jgi:hypothetical protein
MRVTVGVAAVLALLAPGCGLIPPSAVVPTGNPQILMPASGLAEQSQRFDDSLTDESDRPPREDTRRRPEDKSKQRVNLDPRSNQLLSPKWAKEGASQKEDWEKQLDQTVNNVCRGC